MASGTRVQLMGFNCAAPFRERLGDGGVDKISGVVGSFNCAAPFRERLACDICDIKPLLDEASIVPPPFGSG